MFILIAALSIAYILEIHFNTDVFLEYMTLLKLTNYFHIDDFLILQKEGFTGSYLEFLLEYHNCFFVKLIQCPICVSFWLSLFVGIMSFHLSSVLAVSFLSLLFYKILNRLI